MADDQDCPPTAKDCTVEIEDARHLFAWCLIHYGQVPPESAREQAREFYPDQTPGCRYEREMLFHDEAWHWAMLRVVGDFYWIERPELAGASLEYDTESDALSLARGESIPLLDDAVYLGALAHARHMYAWTLIHHGSRTPEQAGQEALERFAQYPRHHRRRFDVSKARDAWIDAMLALHGSEYWNRPELSQPPDTYWTESHAFTLAQGIRLPEPPR